METLAIRRHAASAVKYLFLHEYKMHEIPTTHGKRCENSFSYHFPSVSTDKQILQN